MGSKNDLEQPGKNEKYKLNDEISNNNDITDA